MPATITSVSAPPSATDSDPILRDHAIVLRWFPVTDSSRVVVWFTEHHGRLTTLIKGSQRKKSWMLGQYDLFYTCEVLFYARAREDLHILRECSPLNPRRGLRTQWRGCVGASFVADLLYRASPARASAPRLYQLAELALDLLSRHGGVPALLFWFELQVLRDLGLAPAMESLSPEATYGFDIEAGRILSTASSRSRHLHPLSGGVLALMRRLLDLEHPEQTLRLRVSAEQIREMGGHLDRFARWHLDVDLRSRGLALELMSRTLSFPATTG